MRFLSVFIFITLISSGAHAERWRIKEGVCLEWAGHWDVEVYDRAGVGNQKGIRGTFWQEQVGGSCVAQTGSQISGKVSGLMNDTDGEFIVWKTSSDGNDCEYKADISGGFVAMTSTYRCKSGGPYKFILERYYKD